MTISELIEKLQHLDPESAVFDRSRIDDDYYSDLVEFRPVDLRLLTDSVFVEDGDCDCDFSGVALT